MTRLADNLSYAAAVTLRGISDFGIRVTEFFTRKPAAPADNNEVRHAAAEDRLNAVLDENENKASNRKSTVFKPPSADAEAALNKFLAEDEKQVNKQATVVQPPQLPVSPEEQAAHDERMQQRPLRQQMRTEQRYPKAPLSAEEQKVEQIVKVRDEQYAAVKAKVQASSSAQNANQNSESPYAKIMDPSMKKTAEQKTLSNENPKEYIRQTFGVEPTEASSQRSSSSRGRANAFVGDYQDLAEIRATIAKNHPELTDKPANAKGDSYG